MVCAILHLWMDQQYDQLLPLRNTNDLCTILTMTGVGIFQNYYESTLLRQYSASTIAWIPSLQIFFMYAMVGSFHYPPSYAQFVDGIVSQPGPHIRSFVRQLWTPLLNLVRIASSRLRSDDVFHLDEILSNIALTRCMQRHWSLNHLPTR